MRGEEGMERKRERRRNGEEERRVRKTNKINYKIRHSLKKALIYMLKNKYNEIDDLNMCHYITTKLS